jgi:hypothetical protein
MTDGLLCQEDGLSPRTGLEFPWSSRPLVALAAVGAGTVVL